MNIRVPRNLEHRRNSRKVQSRSEPRRDKPSRFIIKLRTQSRVSVSSPDTDIDIVGQNQCHLIQQLFESANSLQEHIEMVFPKFKGANEVVISPQYKRTEKRLSAGADVKSRKRSLSCKGKKSSVDKEKMPEVDITSLREEITILRNEITALKDNKSKDDCMHDVNQKFEALMKMVIDLKKPTPILEPKETKESLKNQSKSNIPPPPPPIIVKSKTSNAKAEKIKSQKSNASLGAPVKGSISRNQSFHKRNESTNSSQPNLFKNFPRRKILNRSLSSIPDSKITRQKSTGEVSRLQSGECKIPATDYEQYYREISTSDVRCEASQLPNEPNPCIAIVPAQDVLTQIQEIAVDKPFSDIFISVLSYTSTNDFRINVNDKITGKLLGFFMIEESIFEKSYKDGVFDKFLTLFILSPGQANRKSMILNTFLLTK